MLDMFNRNNPKKTKILLLSGRYLDEFRYRELAVKYALEKRGCQVVMSLPSLELNNTGYPEKLKDDPVFNKEKTVFIQNQHDFKRTLKGVDIFLFGTWKSYLPLVDLARSRGIFTANFMSTSGVDHWHSGVDLTCARAEYDRRKLLATTTPLKPPRDLTPSKIVLTGSPIFEYTESAINMSRAEFYAAYDLDPERKLAVLYPKGIGNYRANVAKWFRNWDPGQVDDYCQRVCSIYEKIYRSAQEAGLNLLVKLHPSAYTGYLCDQGEEARYWKRFKGLRALKPEHGLEVLRHLDVGISPTTHAVLDVNYHGKPFIFVDSLTLEYPPPPFPKFHQYCGLPPGPSNEWHAPRKTRQPYPFPSWLGAYSSGERLAGILRNLDQIRVKQNQYQAMEAEFWYSVDGQSADRIAEAVLEGFAKRGQPGFRTRARGLMDFLGHKLPSPGPAI